MSFPFSPSDLSPEALLSALVSFFGAAKVIAFFLLPNFFAIFFNFFFASENRYSRLFFAGAKISFLFPILQIYFEEFFIFFLSIVRQTFNV